MRRTWSLTLVSLALACDGPELSAIIDDDHQRNLAQGELAATSCGGRVPTTPLFTQAVDPLASYSAQTTCDPSAKPGVVAFRDMVLTTYDCTGDSGISRSCTTGGTSEHKEGRAWDWAVTPGNPAADELLGWLLATKDGQRFARARRLGIMYVIWNRQIWGAHRSQEGWRAYGGQDPHTDHVHFSFSWDGADGKTSWWDASAPPDGAPPAPDSQQPIRRDGSTTKSVDLRAATDATSPSTDRGHPTDDGSTPPPRDAGSRADLRGLLTDQGPRQDSVGGDKPAGRGRPSAVSPGLSGSCSASRLAPRKPLLLLLMLTLLTLRLSRRA